MSDDIRYYEAVGRRKRAVARVRLYPGDGQIIINDKTLADFFGRPQDWQSVTAPLALTENENRFNVSVLVKGGGITGQAHAIRHGVARALLLIDPLIYKHGDFPWEDAPGFFAAYGFVSCVLLIFIARILRLWIKRDEMYYG